MPQRPALLIDEFSNPERMSALGTFWRGFTDQVMGGVSTYRGIRLTVKGNGETCHIHLRTTGTALPWQYYHAAFPAGAAWVTIDLPFDGFKAAALESKRDPTQLTRIGVVAYGRAFRADVAVARIEFYR